MEESSRDPLEDLVRYLTEIACSILVDDGEHAAMFFLMLPNGDLEAHEFDDVGRPVGATRAREMALAVAESPAEAIAFVSEAWTAQPEDIPPGGAAGDAPNPLDVLLVALTDIAGNTVATETAITRGANGTVELGTALFAHDYAVGVFDEVRTVWSQRA